MSITQDLNSLQGLTIDEIAQKVGAALEEARKGPTHPADIALKNNFMDITRNVNVPVPNLAFPKAIYRMKPAGKRTPAQVECIAVKNLIEQAEKLSAGWSLAEDFLPRADVQALVNKDDEYLDLSEQSVATLLGSAEPVALPVGRRPGRPKKFSSADGVA